MRQGGLKAFIIHALGGKTAEECRFEVIAAGFRKFPFVREERTTRKVTAVARRRADGQDTDEEAGKSLLSLEIGRKLQECGAIEFKTVEYGPGHDPEIRASVYVSIRAGGRA